jgi:hypothetical protein
MPNRPPKIEIEKCHKVLLASLHQSVTTWCSNFLGTALMKYEG